MPFRKANPWGQIAPPQGTPIDWGDPISVGLRGLWLFGEGSVGTTFNSVRGEHGILTANPTSAPGPNANKSIVLNGTSQDVSLTNAKGSLNAPAGTLCLWIYPTYALGDNVVRVYMTWRVDGNNEIFMDDVNTAAGTRRRFGHSAGGTAKVVNLTTSPVLNTWAHYAITWDKSADQMIGYVNGVQQGTTQTGLGTMAGSPASMFIGNDVFNERFGGRVSNARMYARALKQSEIFRLYSEPFAGFTAPRRRIISQVAAGVVSTYIGARTNRIPHIARH